MSEHNWFRLPTFPTDSGPVRFYRGDEPEFLARKARWDEQRAAAVAQAAEVFDPVYQRADPDLQVVLSIHSPTCSYSDTGPPIMGGPVCYGCDQGPHPEDYPTWPCSTFEAIRDHLGQTP